MHKSCNNFSGVAHTFAWFARGGYRFNKARLSLSTIGLPGETLTGRVRVNIYAANPDPFVRDEDSNHIRGNLLYSSEWLFLDPIFGTTDNRCDQHYSGVFIYEPCEFDFNFGSGVVLQSNHAYLFAFEGDNIDGIVPSDPSAQNSVRLVSLCSRVFFVQDMSELCKNNAQQKMQITFLKEGDISVQPSPLDVYTLPALEPVPDGEPPVVEEAPPEDDGEGEEVVP
jgi:hypothetical protein